MKKVLLLLLCVAFTLSAFMSCEQAEESKADISESKNESQTESTDASEEASEIEESSSDKESDVSDESSAPDESDEISVVNIVCDFEDKLYNAALETIYVDEVYVYFLGSYCSQDITVIYSNGSFRNVKDALADGSVTIEDLDTFDVPYAKRLKSDSSVDRIPEESNKSDLEVTDIVLPSGCYGEIIDLFYSDDEYDYFFPSLTKYSMKVYYSDGSVQSVKEAIDAGNITLADLDKFDIFYLKAPKGTYSEFGR